MDVHDAVVVGAGPAGATAARLLAAQGYRVALFDAAHLGRDKPCGGGLTARARDELPGHLAASVLACVDVAEIRAGPHVRQRLALGRSGAVAMVRRAEFDRRHAEWAAAQGAELRAGEAVLDVGRDAELFTVRTAHGVCRARILLLAAGSESRLGAAVGLAAPRARMAPALEVEGGARSRHLDPRVVVFDYDVPGGYAWAFPKRKVWNVGVLTTRSHPGPSLQQRLHRAIAEWGVDFDGGATVRAEGRRVAMWQGRSALHAGRAAVLGDAAALSDPFFGEGIAGALLSGRLAAAAAADVLSGRAGDLAPYSDAVDAAVGTHMRRARLAARVIYAQPRAAGHAMRLLPPLRHVAVRLGTDAFTRSIGYA